MTNGFGWMKSVAGLALMAGVSMAQAALCSYYSASATNALSTENVAINGDNATDCAGHFSPSPPPAAIANLTTYINGTGSGLPLFGQSDWTDILQINSSVQSLGTGFAGLSFDILGLDFATGDLNFTLKITDNNGATQPNLPIKMDLVIGLKASNDFDFYRFNPIELTGSNTGSYSVAILNPNGSNAQGLSNLYLFGRNVQGCTSNCGTVVPPTGGQTPEPGSLALAGLALAAVGFARRRRA